MITTLRKSVCDNTLKEIIDNMDEIKECLPKWRYALRTKCSVEEVIRQIRDDADRLLPDDITRYQDSDYAKTAVRLLHTSLEGWVPSDADFVQMRNHLLAVLSFSNCQRTGVLTGFSLSHYDLRTERAGSIIFAEAAQKTTRKHGAATFAVNQEEAELIDSYMVFRRGQKFSGMETAPYVFINCTGTRMTPSNVATAMTTAFQSSGYKSRVSCTKIRKACVTVVHQNYPEKRQEVAGHMLHNLQTAVKHYKYYDKQLNSVACSNLIRDSWSKFSTVRNQSPANDESQPPAALAQAPSVDEQPSVSAKCQPPATFFVASTTKSVSSRQSTVPASRGGTGSSNSLEDVLDNCSYEPFQKKICWNKEDRDLVRFKFENFVKRQKTPITEIAAVLNGDRDMRLQLESSLGLSGHKLVQVVRDKVRSFFRWEKK